MIPANFCFRSQLLNSSSNFSKWHGKPAVLFLAAALLGFSGCEQKKPPAAPPLVEVVDVVQKDVPITKQWVATLNGFINAQIRAQVSGYLTKQMYINGTYVKKGSPLFQLDLRPFEAAVDQAEGNLAQAKADLEKAQAELGRTQLDVDRYIPLVKTGAISQQELDDAMQSNLAAKGQVAAAKASIDASQAALASAKLNLGYATVLAPIDGIAGISNAQVGDFEGPSNPNALTTVSTVDPILANITPSGDEYLHLMAVARKASESDTEILTKLVWKLELTDGSTYPQEGRFYALDRQINVQTGAILLQIQFPNPGNLLRPGAFGNVRSVVRLQKGALLIPQRALTEVQGKYLVAVVGVDNKVDIRPVVAGERSGSLWIITDGLKLGERVVAEGTQKVHQGVVVNPKAYQTEASAIPPTMASSSN